MPAVSASRRRSIGPAPPNGISVSSLAWTPARARSCSIGTSMPLIGDLEHALGECRQRQAEPLREGRAAACANAGSASIAPKPSSPWPRMPQSKAASVTVNASPPRPKQAGPGVDPALSGRPAARPGRRSRRSIRRPGPRTQPRPWWWPAGSPRSPGRRRIGGRAIDAAARRRRWCRPCRASAPRARRRRAPPRRRRQRRRRCPTAACRRNRACPAPALIVPPAEVVSSSGAGIRALLQSRLDRSR